jgi:hypothetical protein
LIGGFSFDVFCYINLAGRPPGNSRTCQGLLPFFTVAAECILEHGWLGVASAV